MELQIATPLAAAAEHWIADTDLGDAWAQAKENVADLRRRLVADYRSRMESGVGETLASMSLRKEYDRWVGIHDRLKAFVLDCQAAGRIRDLPPDLAKHFKNWSKLRRELLNDAPSSLDALDASLAAIRADLAGLRGSDAASDARFAQAEALDARAATAQADAEALRAGADAVARHYAADEDVASLARRAADAAADAKALAGKVSALRAELHDAETVRLFEEKVAAFEDGTRRLDDLVAAKARRESDAKALADEIAEDIRAKSFARLPAHRTALDALRAAAEGARPGELECARAVKIAAKDFPAQLGAKAVRALRQNLASDASAARLGALSKRAETAAARHGKTLDAALLNLQNSSFKLEDGAAETAALGEAEKRLARLDALSKR